MEEAYSFVCEVRGLEQQSPPSPSWGGGGGGGGGGGRGSEIVGGGGFGAGMITTLPQRRKSSGKRSAIMVDLHHRGNLGEILCSYPLTLFIAQLTKPLSLFYFFYIIIKRSTIARTPRNTRPLHAHHKINSFHALTFVPEHVPFPFMGQSSSTEPAETLAHFVSEGEGGVLCGVAWGAATLQGTARP